MFKSDLIDLTLHWVFETEKAILVKEYEDADAEVWLPKSLVEYVRQGDQVEVTLPEKIAIEKGLM